MGDLRRSRYIGEANVGLMQLLLAIGMNFVGVAGRDTSIMDSGSPLLRSLVRLVSRTPVNRGSSVTSWQPTSSVRARTADAQRFRGESDGAVPRYWEAHVAGRSASSVGPAPLVVAMRHPWPPGAHGR